MADVVWYMYMFEVGKKVGLRVDLLLCSYLRNGLKGDACKYIQLFTSVKDCLSVCKNMSIHLF